MEIQEIIAQHKGGELAPRMLAFHSTRILPLVYYNEGPTAFFITEQDNKYTVRWFHKPSGDVGTASSIMLCGENEHKHIQDAKLLCERLAKENFVPMGKRERFG